MSADRVGLGWRGELAAGILEHLDAFDVLEVIAEEWMKKPRREVRALRTLGEACPVVLHGVAMGLASSLPVERSRLDAMARVVEEALPSGWSEHLAFVRAGGYEVGHLAAPPRTQASVEGAIANIALAARVVGAAPAVENIATLVDPPASSLDECAWTRAIVDGSNAPMLLDLHNLYANAENFGVPATELLHAMPLARVGMIHLAGGRWITAPSGDRRLLDDHLHDVPDPVYALLEEVASLVPGPLTVLLERDGRFPEVDSLFAELERARHAVALGRARATRALGIAA